MTSKNISNYTELLKAIDELNSKKLYQEGLLKENVNNIKEDVNPISLLKNYLKHVAQDNDLHQSALKAGLTIGSKFIIEKILRSNKSIKRHFFAGILENILSGFNN